MDWLNQPPQWGENNGVITATAAPKTDFWRETHSNHITNNGHFYYQEMSGDFTMQVKISGKYKSLYDQAGMMVRLDDLNWMKCGVEYFNDRQHASAVITRDFSDWSVLPLLANTPAIWMRVIRCGNALEVHYSLAGTNYTMLRQGYFPPVASVQAGLMIAAPTGDGFSATFENLTITP
jgi:regulation of enolase protein 1 (concanavalin A-like superfamily)